MNQVMHDAGVVGIKIINTDSPNRDSIIMKSTFTTWTDEEDITTIEDISDDMSVKNITEFLLKREADEVVLSNEFVEHARNIMTNIWLKTTGCDYCDNSLNGGNDQWYVLWIERNREGKFSSGHSWVGKVTKKYVLNKILQQETPNTLQILCGDPNETDNVEISFWDILTDNDSLGQYNAFWKRSR